MPMDGNGRDDNDHRPLEKRYKRQQRLQQFSGDTLQPKAIVAKESGVGAVPTDHFSAAIGNAPACEVMSASSLAIPGELR